MTVDTKALDRLRDSWLGGRESLKPATGNPGGAAEAVDEAGDELTFAVPPSLPPPGFPRVYPGL